MVLDRAGAAGGGATEHTCSPRVPGAEGEEGEVAVGLAHGMCATHARRKTPILQANLHARESVSVHTRGEGTSRG